MPNWLLYIHTPNHKDLKYGKRALLKMQKILAPDVNVYVMHFGPTVLADCTLHKFTKSSVQELMRRHSDGLDSVVPNMESFVNGLLQNNVAIDATCLWMHGAGYAGGPFKKWRLPFIQITDAVRLLIEPFKVPLVCFDSCFQGSMSGLYQLPKHVQVTVASPAFHPYCSIVWSRAFGNLKATFNKTELLEYGHSIACEWNDETKAKYKCLLVFDMDFIDLIAELVKQNFEKLKFDKYSQCDSEDANLYDIFRAARNVPLLQAAVTQSYYHCDLCITECSNRINGMSMEAHLPRKWLTAFASTRWYQEIVKDKRGFEVSRLQKMFNNGKI